jgi:hypothetical protein
VTTDNYNRGVLEQVAKTMFPGTVFKLERPADYDGIGIACWRHVSATGDHGHYQNAMLEEGWAKAVLNSDEQMEYAILMLASAELGLTLWEIKCNHGECGWRGYN